MQHILLLLFSAFSTFYLYFGLMGISESAFLLFLSLWTPVGPYSSLLSSRTVPLQCWGWSPHSSAQTTPSRSSLAFRTKWTADMTCTRLTRQRSTLWRPTRWALMHDLSQWLSCADPGGAGNWHSLHARSHQNHLYWQLNSQSHSAGLTLPAESNTQQDLTVSADKTHDECRLNINTLQVHIQSQRAGFQSWLHSSQWPTGEYWQVLLL